MSDVPSRPTKVQIRSAALLLAGAGAAHCLQNGRTFVPAPLQKPLLRAAPPQDANIQPALLKSSAPSAEVVAIVEDSSSCLAAKALAVMVTSAAGRHARKQQPDGQRRRVVRQVSGGRVGGKNRQKDADESADVDEQVQALERQAAMLRDSAIKLQETQDETRSERLSKKKRMLFLEFDTDKSGGVDAKELIAGWKEFTNVDLSADMAARTIAAHDLNNSGVLEFEEFDVKCLQATMETFRAEDLAKEFAARQAEDKLKKEQEVKEYYASLDDAITRQQPGETGNDDSGFVTRMLSAAAYLLPLVDAVRYGLVIGFLFPSTMDFFVPLVELYRAQETIPYASLIIFLLMQFLAGRKELPSLLRFNLYQAVRLDITLFIPALVKVGAGQFIPDENLSAVVTLACGVLAFMQIFFAVSYSVANVTAGVAPRMIPYASAAAEQDMGLERPVVDVVEPSKDNKEDDKTEDKQKNV